MFGFKKVDTASTYCLCVYHFDHINYCFIHIYICVLECSSLTAGMILLFNNGCWNRYEADNSCIITPPFQRYLNLKNAIELWLTFEKVTCLLKYLLSQRNVTYFTRLMISYNGEWILTTKWKPSKPRLFDLSRQSGPCNT